MKKDATATVSGTLNKDLSKYTSANSLVFKDCIQYIDKDGVNVNTPTKTCVGADGPLNIYFQIYDSVFYSGKKGHIKANANSQSNVFTYDGSGGTYNLTTYQAINSNRGDIQADVSYKKDVKVLNQAFNNNNTVREKYNSMNTACVGELYSHYALVKATNDVLQYQGQFISYDSKIWKLTITQLPQTVKYQ